MVNCFIIMVILETLVEKIYEIYQKILLLHYGRLVVVRA